MMTTAIAKILTLSWTTRSTTTYGDISNGRRTKPQKEAISLNRDEISSRFLGGAGEGGGYSNAKFCESAACF